MIGVLFSIFTVFDKNDTCMKEATFSFIYFASQKGDVPYYARFRFG